ncbi:MULTISPECIES: ATP-binding cassette domain-containing protein [unclassified Adlercreutzia]|uniref:ATP-binding cassette domain-containing protein n=1 Tax=unclassified Adlercreutzia TaxID=2636013 RepID=UPI0013EC26BA|nr:MULTISPECIES: ATP-binding cassette domain-containing protein [unclassified Adlercreutzia]
MTEDGKRALREDAQREDAQRERMRHEDARHEQTRHEDAQAHHHHTHAPASRHAHGHHLLQVEDLTVSFRMYDAEEPYLAARQREVRPIERLSISVHAGEIVAVVGASGSGKSLLADAVMGLFEPNATVTGRIWFDGEPMDAAALARVRGRGIALVPQSVASLDPLMKVGAFVRGAACGRGRARREDAAQRARRQRELFARYGLAPEVEDLYPHELSGGMARRVLLCCALMDAPRVIVADEPTPGLDLELAVRAMDDFRAFADAGGGVMLITHDIELALRVADRVAVFKDGTVVEETAVANFAAPELLEHPFSRALWHALPEHGFAAFAGAGAGTATSRKSADAPGEGPAEAGARRAAGAAAAPSEGGEAL